MALQPSLAPLVVAGDPTAPHTLDIFLDYTCPFSAKLALNGIQTVLAHKLSPRGQYAGKVKVIFRPQVQPWHSTSTLTHEAGLAVLRAAPEKFWEFSIALFKNQADYFDAPTLHLTTAQIRDSLIALAGTIITPEQVEKVKGLLRLGEAHPNAGTAVVDDLKYTIKFSRQNGIHVSPTVLFDGLVANEISSGWGEEEWAKWLVAKVQA
ncbi:hypothetical protein FA13DRAFT_1726232 [Coprinellus micaceus]|uniref:Thioredoxin-like fold domain-containing protein n=1 Tax=Coprinellus micaceus TaxID=71717 RepID=A0A4Y7TSD3_COPMI|nr:hypothetical protein FA13DRAFT_1726232 [Coprinellus micaceus]